jgi:hypothetical protein
MPDLGHSGWTSVSLYRHTRGFLSKWGVLAASSPWLAGSQVSFERPTWGPVVARSFHVEENSGLAAIRDKTPAFLERAKNAFSGVSLRGIWRRSLYQATARRNLHMHNRNLWHWVG